MSFRRLISDRVHVRLDPISEKTRGGIIIPDTSPRPVRKGVVLDVGPGRYVKVRQKGTTTYSDRWLPVEVKKGDRVVFFSASVDTKTGQAVTYYLQEDERVIRENDVLFVIPEGADVEVTV